MNIMIYACKHDFDVQKAERWFKERNIKFTSVDMKRHPPAKREMELFYRKIGLVDLMNRSKKEYLESTVRFLQTPEPIMEALMQKPELLNTPIVRNGNEVTAGYKPEVWSEWK